MRTRFHERGQLHCERFANVALKAAKRGCFLFGGKNQAWLKHLFKQSSVYSSRAFLFLILSPPTPDPNGNGQAGPACGTWTSGWTAAVFRRISPSCPAGSGGIPDVAVTFSHPSPTVHLARTSECAAPTAAVKFMICKSSSQAVMTGERGAKIRLQICKVANRGDLPPTGPTIHHQTVITNHL